MPSLRPDDPRVGMYADAWVEWLGEHTGEVVALDDGTRVPETNFMARAEIGDTTGCYVKTGPLEWSRREPGV